MNINSLHSKVDLFKTGGEISYKGDASVAKFLLGGLEQEISQLDQEEN